MKIEKKRDSKLVYAIVLLVLLIIILLYAILNINNRYQHDVATLNARLVEFNAELQNLPEPTTTTITKYVCADGRIVDVAANCQVKAKQPGPVPVDPVLAPIGVSPIDTNEISSKITNVTVAPTCVAGYDGGKFYYDASIQPTNVLVQVRDVINDKAYEVKREYGSTTKKWRAFSLCESDELKCPYEGDFSLTKGTVYFFQLSFNYTNTLGEFQKSNEYIVDTREGSSYTEPICRR